MQANNNRGNDENIVSGSLKDNLSDDKQERHEQEEVVIADSSQLENIKYIDLPELISENWQEITDKLKDELALNWIIIENIAFLGVENQSLVFSINPKDNVATWNHEKRFQDIAQVFARYYSFLNDKPIFKTWQDNYDSINTIKQKLNDEKFQAAVNFFNTDSHAVKIAQTFQGQWVVE